MDNIRQLIVDRAKEQGRSLRRLSLAIHKHPGYLHQFVNYGSPHELPEQARNDLAKELDLAPHLLRAEPPAGASQLGGLPKLPVMGHGVAGQDLIMINEGPIEFVERPHFLSNVPDAFAVFSWGTSMEPRIRPGLLLYINPHRPPRAGDDVLVEQTDGQALIKEFVRRTAEEIILRQLNPEETIKIPTNCLRGAYKVVGTFSG